jgi:diacylglycerol O-acyltransferase / wax synthase
VPLGLGRPVWIDDANLDLEYHVRHTALPPPGGVEPLKKLAARIFAQRLDRDRPLWELWLVEGLAGDRFAIISKTHHCMLDGVSGADLATVLLGVDPDDVAPAEPAPWTPRPAPAAASLVARSVAGQVTHPLQLVRGAFQPSSPARRVLLELGAGLKPLLGLSRLGRAPPSSLNRPIGPHRRWEMVSLDLAEVKAVRAGLGGTVNDVLLAVVAGALRQLFEERDEPPPAEIRALIPVSVRGNDSPGALGNRVTALFCALPVGEPDPWKRLRAVAGEMKSLKESGQAVGALAWTHLGDFAPPALLAQVARFQSTFRYMNLVVTNIPGPQQPIYLLGRKMLEWYPLVPLAQGQTLGIAIQSYDGKIGIGLLGDAEALRDLPVLAKAIPAALAELTALAAKATAAGGR